MVYISKTVAANVGLSKCDHGIGAAQRGIYLFSSVVKCLGSFVDLKCSVCADLIVRKVVDKISFVHGIFDVKNGFAEINSQIIAWVGFACGSLSLEDLIFGANAGACKLKVVEPL